MSEKKILVSGVKPSGRPHIGNYFGAMKQFVDLQEEYDCRIFIADLHSLTTQSEPDLLRSNTRDVLIDYLAIGLDPKKVTIYKQSDMPQVAELSWIFSCLTTMPYLMRAHAFKDAEAKNKEINVGVFNYPLLMSADILIHNADVVPVGKDQKQHIEIARDTAEKFNRAFTDTFKLPEALILESVMTIPGTDGQKMSKSYGNTIPLFAEDDEEIKKIVMSIVTDSKTPDEPKDPETDNIFALHKLVTEGDELEDLRERYKSGKISYKESKEILLKNMLAFITPLREKRLEVERIGDSLMNILEEGKEKVTEIASEKMNEVRNKVGLTN